MGACVHECVCNEGVYVGACVCLVGCYVLAVCMRKHAVCAGVLTRHARDETHTLQASTPYVELLCNHPRGLKVGCEKQGAVLVHVRRMQAHIQQVLHARLMRHPSRL